ncbi:MAG TPA: hypothetical protein VD902_12265, partial [Symbiobacteriaceae bacterium]|nr:hypothetical protein [Symbiobacteriaceae bacterium]
MQPTGISPNLVRLLTATAPDLMTELLTPGKVLDADVVSVYQDKAVLAFGRGVRLEVTLQTPLQEGQRVRVQVQPQPQGPQQTGQGQTQGQSPARASRQAAATGAQPAPVILKVIGSVPPEASGRAQAPVQAGQAPAQAGQAPAQAGQAPAQAGQAPAQAGQAPAQAGQAPAQA